MYRRPKSLEVLLAIRTAMSEEAGYDIPAFVELVRTGVIRPENTRTVTRVEADINEEVQGETVAENSEIKVSDS